MADLNVRLGPLTVKNPVWVGSSELTMDLKGLRSCIDAGAGAVVAKSVNESPAARDQLLIADYAYVGADRQQVRPGPGASLLNRSGLARAELDDWCAMLDEARSHAGGRDCRLIGSITLGSTEGAARIAARLEEVTDALEFNIGAPHGREAAGGAVRQLDAMAEVAHAVAAVRASYAKPLLVKLPGAVAHIGAMALAAQEAGADAVTMIGRFNGFLPDIETGEPVLGSWAAYGGPWCLPISLHAVSKAYRDPALAVPLVGTNGVRSGEDVIRFLLSGACAVEVVDLVWQQGPGVLAELLTSVEEYLERRAGPAGKTGLERVIGLSARKARAYAEIEPRGEIPRVWDRDWRTAVSWPRHVRETSE